MRPRTSATSGFPFGGSASFDSVLAMTDGARSQSGRVKHRYSKIVLLSEQRRLDNERSFTREGGPRQVKTRNSLLDENGPSFGSRGRAGSKPGSIWSARLDERG